MLCPQMAVEIDFVLADSRLLPSGRNYVCWQSQSRGERALEICNWCPTLDGCLPATAFLVEWRSGCNSSTPNISSLRTPSLCVCRKSPKRLIMCRPMCRCMDSGSICGGSTQMPSSHPTTSLQAYSEALHLFPAAVYLQLPGSKSCESALQSPYMSYHKCVC